MSTNYFNLDSHTKTLNKNTKYRQAFGALLYVATLTRPDFAATVNILGRRNESPREADWEAVVKIIRYLRTTKHLIFTIDKEKPLVLAVYWDSDWAGDREARKSTTWNVFKL